MDVRTLGKAVVPFLAVTGIALLAAASGDLQAPLFEWEVIWYRVVFEASAEAPGPVPELRDELVVGSFESLCIWQHWGQGELPGGFANEVGFHAESRIYVSYPQTAEVTIRADDAFRLRAVPVDASSQHEETGREVDPGCENCLDKGASQTGRIRYRCWRELE